MGLIGVWFVVFVITMLLDVAITTYFIKQHDSGYVIFTTTIIFMIIFYVLNSAIFRVVQYEQ